MKQLRIVSLIVLVIAVLISLDLLINVIGSLIPALNDGIGLHTVTFLGSLFFRDEHAWGQAAFYNAFVTSALATFVIFVENVAVTIVDIILDAKKNN